MAFHFNPEFHVAYDQQFRVFRVALRAAELFFFHFDPDFHVSVD